MKKKDWIENPYTWITFTGFLLIIVSVLLPSQWLWFKNLCSPISGALLGIGVTGLVTTRFDSSALEKIEESTSTKLLKIQNWLQEITNARISSQTDTEKKFLNDLSKKKELYRYYKTETPEGELI